MALIICPDCSKQISSATPSCPNCGRPIAEKATQALTEVYNPRQDRFLTRNRGFFETLFWLALGMLIFFLLFGCAPATVQGLRENPAGSITFEAPENYQSVYRKIMTPARDCWQQGASLLTADMDVHGELYSDIRKGSISITARGGAGAQTYMAIDIVALADNKTRITTYYALRGSLLRAKAVEEWVKNNSTACHVQEKDL